ncbi:hypothetical protein APHAL10511_004693 [Amanita phalloides]|nr:hypothetical protein APHAL10511_004693 [Amanita phalloides]
MHRFVGLPPQLHILIHCRLAGTTASSSASASGNTQRFLFPTHPSPTPHQIFHLPCRASQRDIKSRYYELVRIYHPDSPHCRMVPHAERHARFQAIATAYDVLRGKAHIKGGQSYRSPADNPFEDELTRRRNAYWAHPSRQTGYAEHMDQRRAKNEWSSTAENTTLKDRIIILFGALTLLAGILPGFIIVPTYLDKRHRTAAANLKRARSDAREFGDARMAEIRRRVHESKSQET